MEPMDNKEARLASLEARVTRLATLLRIDEMPPETASRPRPPRMATVIAACAQVWEVTPETIYSIRRNRCYAWPRQAAMYLSRELGHHSLPAIGTAFNRDHSTVQHGVRAAAARLHADPEFKARVDAAAALAKSLTQEAPRP